MKHGQIDSFHDDDESKLQPLDFSWLPHECEKLSVVDGAFLLPDVEMTQFTRLHTMELLHLTRANLTRSPSYWPPHLHTLIVESGNYAVYHQEYSEEGGWDPAVLIPPELLTLPPTLTELQLPHQIFSSDRFREQQSDIIPWPKGLTRLTYCGPLVGRGWILPDSLTHLKIVRIPQSLHGWLVPRNLKSLMFPDQFDCSLEKIIWPADSITEIDLGEEWNHSLKDARLPESLLTLTIRGEKFAQEPNQLVFPSRLTSVTLFWQCHAIPYNQMLNLPDSITHLYLEQFDVPLKKIHLPASLTSLRLPSIFNHPIESVILPAGLKELFLGDAFNHPVEKWQPPPSLESVHFGAAFNQPVLALHLPSSIRCLSFGESWNQPIRGFLLPDNLNRLSLGSFNQLMKGVRLPEQLTQLVLSARFTQIEGLMKIVLPKTLRSLSLPSPEKFTTSLSYQRYRDYVEKLQKKITVVLHPATKK